jgi:hypothetical protein
MWKNEVREKSRKLLIFQVEALWWIRLPKYYMQTKFNELHESML